MTEVVFGYVTAADAETALAIGRTLVEERLAACANILPGMRSVYRWQGAVEEAAETVLIVKTRVDLAPAVQERVVALHGYDCPCVAFLPVASGHAPYLDWIRAVGDPPEPP